MVKIVSSVIKKAPVRLLSLQNISLGIIGFGIIVRLAQYLSNRSLWSDEASLALNIVNRSFLELFQPLDYDQAAPIGFLLIEKALIQLFGNNEYVLRFFPLICGLLSLFLLYVIAQKYLQPLAVVIAIAILANSSNSIYYSSEVKQYSSDVAIALLCFLIAQQMGSQKLKRNQILIASLTGSILLWVSHPAIFVLLGVGIGSVLWKWLKKEPIEVRKVFPIFFSWIGSFLWFYWMALKPLTNHKNLMTSWSEKAAFPTSFLDFNWLYKSLTTFFDKPLDFDKVFVYFAVAAFMVGCFSLLHRNQKFLILLLLPILTTLFAAYLQKYPFRDRLVLFLTPFFMLIVAEGVAYALEKMFFLVDSKTKKASSKTAFTLKVVLAMAVTVPILVPLFIESMTLLVEPEIKDQIKPIISYIKTHQQPRDVLYIFQRGANQFVYYAPKYGYQETDYRVGVDDLDIEEGKPLSLKEQERYQADLDRLKGNPRVWIVLCHFNREENSMVLSYLDRMGRRLDSYQNRGSSVYLYDLSQ